MADSHEALKHLNELNFRLPIKHEGRYTYQTWLQKSRNPLIAQAQKKWLDLVFKLSAQSGPCTRKDRNCLKFGGG